MNIGQNIKRHRRKLNMTLEDVAKKVGLSRQTLSRYETGVIGNIPSDKIELLANTLETTPAALMGWDEPSRPVPPHTEPLPRMKEWPVLGATACGRPLHRETLDETILASEDIKADVVFRCVGDSMINARIFDGDAVFIRLQPKVEKGQIAVVRLGDEYTLKRVYAGEGYVELRAENPTVAPIVLRGESELEDFEIVGLAVAFLSPVK